jgi:hypothetical protein
MLSEKGNLASVSVFVSLFSHEIAQSLAYINARSSGFCCMYVWMCKDPAVCQGKFRDANSMYMQMWCKLMYVRDDAWLHDGYRLR